MEDVAEASCQKLLKRGKKTNPGLTGWMKDRARTNWYQFYKGFNRRRRRG